MEVIKKFLSNKYTDDKGQKWALDCASLLDETVEVGVQYRYPKVSVFEQSPVTWVNFPALSQNCLTHLGQAVNLWEPPL